MNLYMLYNNIPWDNSSLRKGWYYYTVKPNLYLLNKHSLTDKLYSDLLMLLNHKYILPYILSLQLFNLSDQSSSFHKYTCYMTLNLHQVNKIQDHIKSELMITLGSNILLDRFKDEFLFDKPLKCLNLTLYLEEESNYQYPIHFSILLNIN